MSIFTFISIVFLFTFAGILLFIKNQQKLAKILFGTAAILVIWILFAYVFSHETKTFHKRLAVHNCVNFEGIQYNTGKSGLITLTKTNRKNMGIEFDNKVEGY